MLQTLSPFNSIYAIAEQEGYEVEYKKFRRSDVQRVESIALEIGKREEVKTDGDWQAVEKILKFYGDTWPQEAQEFISTVPEIRQSRRAGGYSKSRETKYLGSIPGRLMRIIKIFFPLQQWDKDFSNKFINKFKLFMVGGQTNLSTGKVVL